MNYGIVTVDTEGHDGIDPLDHLVWGRLSDGRAAGIDLIMDIVEEYHTKALFFVDFAEAWDYGEEKIRSIVEHIAQKGHDIGVHIHPDHMADPERMFLWEYSKEEQYNLIIKCTELYEKILGYKPRSFRAGKYSANIDTLDILNELGYKYDFSQFMGQKWCGINPAITADRPCIYKNLVEFPVTVFTAIKMPGFQRIDKIDMEMATSEFYYVMKRLNRGEENVVSLFLHSFSFLKWRKNPNCPILWKHNIKKVKKALKYVKKLDNFQLISEGYLDKMLNNGALKILEEGHMKPQVQIKNWFAAYFFLLISAIRICAYNRKARMLLFLNCAFIIFIAFCILFYFR